MRLAGQSQTSSGLEEALGEQMQGLEEAKKSNGSPSTFRAQHCLHGFVFGRWTWRRLTYQQTKLSCEIKEKRERSGVLSFYSRFGSSDGNGSVQRNIRRITGRPSLVQRHGW